MPLHLPRTLGVRQEEGGEDEVPLILKVGVVNGPQLLHEFAHLLGLTGAEALHPGARHLQVLAPRLHRRRH